MDDNDEHNNNNSAHNDRRDGTPNNNNPPSTNTPAIHSPHTFPDDPQHDSFADLASLAREYLYRAPAAQQPAGAASNMPQAGLPIPIVTHVADTGLEIQNPLQDIVMADAEVPPSLSTPADTTPMGHAAGQSAPPRSFTVSPAPGPSRSTRRARVEDDVDEDDLRESNRQRLHSPQAQRSQPLPHHPPNPPPHGPGHPHAGAEHGTIPHRIVFDFNLGPIGDDAGAPNPPHDQMGGPPPQGQPPVTINQLFSRMGGRPGFFDMLFGGMSQMGEEPDDPERAKRLMAGLEEVPVGLVKRLQRVGGNGDKDSGPGCAICFESLLDGDGGFGEDRSREEDQAEQLQNDDQSTASASTSSSSLSTSTDGDNAHSKVVVLPCSHVFHAACLLPWFTRAHRTTCPSCRFDIDPDSLTYVPRSTRPMRSMPRRTRPQEANAQGTPAGGVLPNHEPPLPSVPNPQGGGGNFDFFVVDLLGGPNGQPPTMVNGPHPHIGEHHPHPNPFQPPPQQPHPDTGNHPDNQGRTGADGSYLSFDVSMAFSFVGPATGDQPEGPEENIGHAHFHIPFFGGTFPTAAPPGPGNNADAQPPSHAVPPAPEGHPPSTADTPAQPGNADARRFFQQILGGLFGRVAGGANSPPTNTTNPPVNPAAPAATAQQPPTPPRTHHHLSPEANGTAGTGPVPPPPTFAQLFQRLFPQPPSQAQAPNHAPPPPHVPPSMPPAAGHMSPEQRRAMADMLASLVPGVHFMPSATAQGNNVEGAGDAANNGNSNANVQDGLNGMPIFSFGPPPAPAAGAQLPPLPPFDMFGFGMAPLPGHGSRARTRAAQPAGAGTDAENAAPPKREWVLPPPPGPTLQQRVEKRERELGLRCSDVSCGLGPTDDDPEPALDVDVTKIPQVGIHRLGNNEQDVCDHRFHLACLVSAERVAGWGDKDVGENGEVEVSCPVCRAVGCVTKQEWDEGVAALA